MAYSYDLFFLGGGGVLVSAINSAKSSSELFISFNGKQMGGEQIPDLLLIEVPTVDFDTSLTILLEIVLALLFFLYPVKNCIPLECVIYFL